MKTKKRLIISASALVMCIMLGLIAIILLPKNSDALDINDKETTTEYGSHSVEIYTTDKEETTLSDKEMLAMLEKTLESYEKLLEELEKSSVSATTTTPTDKTTENESTETENPDESTEPTPAVTTEGTTEDKTETTPGDYIIFDEQMSSYVVGLESAVNMLQWDKDQLILQNFNANEYIKGLNDQVNAYAGINTNLAGQIDTLKQQINQLNQQLAAAVIDNQNAQAAASSAIAAASSAVAAATTAAPPAAGGNSSSSIGTGTGFKYLAIGNSITLHPTCDYWWNFCGMAATTPDKDYFHIVTGFLSNKYGGNITATTYNYAIWEYNGNDRSETFYSLDPHLSADLDLITIQMGENATNVATFQTDMIELINHLRAVCPNTKIILVDDFWEYEGRSAMKAAAASATGTPFVNLTSIRNNPDYKVGMGATVYDANGNPHTVNHAGVAEHPNDAAMSFIANGIIGFLN